MPNDIITVSELPDPNCTYTVTCNGVEYECIPTSIDEAPSTFPLCTLGNLNLLDSSLPNTREPFLISFFYNEDDITLEFNFEDNSIDNTISIDKVTTSVKPLDTVLSRRIINLTKNPYVLYYFDHNEAWYAHIDTNLSVVDLLNSIVTRGQFSAECICMATVLQNKLIALAAWDYNYLYNPYSGYVSFRNNWDSINAYDISSIVEVEDVKYFLDATLQYKDGDPVICNFVKYNDDDAEVVLVAAEPVLKDSSGNIIHDFTIGPIIYNRDTHKFIYGDTSWPTV